MANSHQRRQLRRLLLRLGLPPLSIAKKLEPQKHTDSSPKSMRLKMALGVLWRIPKAWKVLGFLLGIPSLYVGIAEIIPTVAIEPQELLDQTSFFSFPIRVSNTSAMGINNVELTCVIDAKFGHSEIRNTLAHEPVNMMIGSLARNGFTTTFCQLPELFTLPPTSGHATVNVKFRPDFSPFYTNRRFYLTAMFGEKDHVHWVNTSQ